MSDRFVTVTVETRAGEDEICGEEITAIYNFDLAEDGPRSRGASTRTSTTTCSTCWSSTGRRSE